MRTQSAMFQILYVLVYSIIPWWMHVRSKIWENGWFNHNMLIKCGMHFLKIVFHSGLNIPLVVNKVSKSFKFRGKREEYNNVLICAWPLTIQCFGQYSMSCRTTHTHKYSVYILYSWLGQAYNKLTWSVLNTRIHHYTVNIPECALQLVKACFVRSKVKPQCTAINDEKSSKLTVHFASSSLHCYHALICETNIGHSKLSHASALWQVTPLDDLIAYLQTAPLPSLHGSVTRDSLGVLVCIMQATLTSTHNTWDTKCCFFSWNQYYHNSPSIRRQVAKMYYKRHPDSDNS